MYLVKLQSVYTIYTLIKTNLSDIAYPAAHVSHITLLVSVKL